MQNALVHLLSAAGSASRPADRAMPVARSLPPGSGQLWAAQLLAGHALTALSLVGAILIVALLQYYLGR